MIAILLIHEMGGFKSILGSSVEDTYRRCRVQCAAYPKAYVAATLPYEVYPGVTGAPDVTLLARNVFGSDIVKLYERTET